MPRVPIVSGSEAVRALQRLGFNVDRQRVAAGTLRSALKMAGVSVEEFTEAL